MYDTVEKLAEINPYCDTQHPAIPVKSKHCGLVGDKMGLCSTRKSFSRFSSSNIDIKQKHPNIEEIVAVLRLMCRKEEITIVLPQMPPKDEEENE